MGVLFRCEERLKEALKLKTRNRRAVVDGILRSLDQPDASIDAIWAEEAQQRLEAYHAGRLPGIPMEDFFRNQTIFGLEHS